MTWKRAIPILTIATLLAAGGVGFVWAQTDTSQPLLSILDPSVQAEVDALNQTIEQRKAQLEDLNQQIESYKRQISAKEAQQETFQNELEILTSRMAQTNLDMKATQTESDTVNAEIAVLDKRSRDMESQLQRQRDLIQVLLQKIDSADNSFDLQTLFSTDSFNELFDRLQSLESVNGDLLNAVKRAEDAKKQVAAARAGQQVKHDRLVVLAESLQAAQSRLEEESAFKKQLIDDTRASESRFQALVQTLKREQTQTNADMSALQEDLERRLHQKNPGASATLAWPVDTSYRGLSTLFRDPTYPFRNLFEHTGVDVPQPQGTQVHAAAPGYVAWVRSGQLYGNYVMIVHADGMATLYAHLSKVYVRQDQYVNQGDVIALSGGRPGTPGAGFSTGPHLHFEVRRDGIPVNPLDYLPAAQ